MATESPAFQLGLNHPWVTCGHDFGPRPPAWSGARGTDWGEVERQLAEARAAGVRVSRWWVLAGGVNYPAGAHPDEAFAFDGQRFHRRLALPSLPDAFLADFDALLRACANAGVRLVPSLLSFEAFFPAERQGPRVHSGGRAPVILGDARGHGVDAFLDAVLAPLLEVSRGRAATLEAWEPINEPDWVVRGGPLHLRVRAGRLHRMPKTVAPEAMARFLDRALDRILDAGFRATIGFKQADPRWLPAPLRARLQRLGRASRYVHQLHYYPSLHEPTPLPAHDTLPIRPCVVGEMPTARGRWLDPFFMRWLDGGPARWRRETDPDAYLRQRLELVDRLRGYPGAWLWSARGEDGASRWGPAQRAQVRAHLDARR